eukprot:CAMPEP_0194347186 /NCGR_PEP_ID=MMETSP0171-20130528/105845_1 /TAXON_ID=218684 /ORGANISM="Corethron pennatum, Strain L29A3" /LENGTH=77 /DNA_ID=CAMNT_0039114407 /DNA_START=1954 /DNA_END=2190 /DNA_ORIENTATION=-
MNIYQWCLFSMTSPPSNWFFSRVPLLPYGRARSIIIFSCFGNIWKNEGIACLVDAGITDEKTGYDAGITDEKIDIRN